MPSVQLHSLISAPSPTTLATFPPNSKPPNSLPKPKPKPQRQSQQQCRLSRRDLALLSLSSLLLSPPPPATAFSIGISGPKDWLKDQKKKSSKFLLAPIDASRQSLRAAYLLLTDRDLDYLNKDMEEVQRLLSSAARDCVPEERNSFVSFQANTGVEVCTFRLILKNAASLLANKDPVKLEAEAILDDLIRSLTSLQTLANQADIKLSTERQKIADSLLDTISSLDKFENGVKDCLEI